MRQGLGKKLHQTVADHLGQQADSVASVAGRPGRLFFEYGPGFCKRDRLPSRWVLQQRGLKAVRVIDRLQGGLTAHAEFTLIDGMFRVALQLDDATLPVFGQHTTARRTLTAG